MDPGVWREDVWVTSSPHLVESRPVTGCLSINSVIWVDGSLRTPFTLSLEICLSDAGHKVKSGDHCAELVNFKFLAVMGLFWQVMASPPHQTCVKLASFGKTTLAQLNSDLSRKLGEMTGGIRENLNSSHHSSHPKAKLICRQKHSSQNEHQSCLSILQRQSILEPRHISYTFDCNSAVWTPYHAVSVYFP